MLSRPALSAALLLGILTLTRCHSDEPQDPVETPLAWNEQAAGTYTGLFECVSYNGTAYLTDTMFGTLELVAVGADSVQVAGDAGCIFYSPRFRYDSTASSGQAYTYWDGGLYQQLYYFEANDSLLISAPQHFSPGWLGRSFKGKKN